MEYLNKINAIIRTKNGEDITFDSPATDGENYLSWSFEECDGVTACYVSGACKDDFDCEAGIRLRPEIDGAQINVMAVRNHGDFWCIPMFYSSLREVKEDARLQSLLVEENGRYRYYIPVCDSKYKTIISGYEGGVEFRTFSNCDFLTECDRQLAFVYGEGDDPFELFRHLAEVAARLLDNGLRMREERVLPEVFEYLGWCSWDAMQIRVNHEGLLKKAREFKVKNVPVRFAIIDDMWADCPDLNDVPADVSFRDMVLAMHATRMRSFEGDPKRFPKGMKAAIADLKAEGIDKVGVWFPTTGYWKGFSSEGEAQEMADLLQMSPGDRLIS